MKYSKCPKCNGSGKRNKMRCWLCDGDGIFSYRKNRPVYYQGCNHVVGISRPRWGKKVLIYDSDQRQGRKWRGIVLDNCPLCNKQVWREVTRKDKVGEYKIKTYVGDGEEEIKPSIYWTTLTLRISSFVDERILFPHYYTKKVGIMKTIALFIFSIIIFPVQLFALGFDWIALRLIHFINKRAGYQFIVLE